MSSYAGLLAKIDSLKSQFRESEDPVVKSAVKVLEQTLLKSVRDKHMDIMSEFHSHLTFFDNE